MIRFLKSKRAARARPSVPAGARVYAIGDIHGRLDCLRALLDRIGEDNDTRGPADVHLILLGDLIDRGPDSAGVVRLARAMQQGSDNVRILKGNHEEVLIEAYHGDARATRGLIEIGGGPTLASYGIGEEEAGEGTFEDLAALIGARIPAEDVDFLDAGEDMVRMGDYLFVHAGIRPGVPFEEQRGNDLRWIRGEFLRSTADHSAVVVHGHTITDAVDEQANRIGIDTGAHRSGVLTAIGLEGEDRWFLSTEPDPAPDKGD